MIVFGSDFGSVLFQVPATGGEPKPVTVRDTERFTADGKIGGDKKRISTNGGVQPKWRGDGQELFYIANDGQLMSVAVKTGGSEF